MMKNMANMLKQAQQMQKNMKELQDKMADMEQTGQAAGGLVKVTMTGKNVVKRVEIAPDAVDPADVETLEDLVAAAVNDAVAKVQEMVNAEVSKVTGGASLPGM